MLTPPTRGLQRGRGRESRHVRGSLPSLSRQSADGALQQAGACDSTLVVAVERRAPRVRPRPSTSGWAVTDAPGGRPTQRSLLQECEGPARTAGCARPAQLSWSTVASVPRMAGRWEPLRGRAVNKP